MDDLQAEVDRLRHENAALREEIAFLRTHPTLRQGMKGETVVRLLAGGTPAARYAESFDLTVGSNLKIEIKFSKLNSPSPGASTRRWNSSKPLGYLDKGKDFDLLVLVGEKDTRFESQYPAGSPYVFFLVPKSNVPSIVTSGRSVGGNVQVVTNLQAARSPASLALKQHLVSPDVFESLVECSPVQGWSR